MLGEPDVTLLRHRRRPGAPVAVDPFAVGDGLWARAGTSTAKARPTRSTPPCMPVQGTDDCRCIEEFLADLRAVVAEVGDDRADDRSTNYADRVTRNARRGSDARSSAAFRPTRPDVAVAADDELPGRQLAQAHGAAGVQLLGGDADLGAEAELLAVDEPGRRVDEHGGGVDLAAPSGRPRRGRS